MSDLVVVGYDDECRVARTPRPSFERVPVGRHGGRRQAVPAAAGAVSGVLAAALLLILNGCAVGPNFVKPAPEMPPEYRSDLVPAEAESFADTPWFDVFQDATLRALIDEALANNYDLSTATARVEQARQLVGV